MADLQIITDPAELQRPELALTLIEQLRGGAALRWPWNEIKKHIGALVAGAPWISYTPDKQIQAWRGRIASNVECFDHVKHFGCPPASLLTNFGRCNPPHTPVFYAANSIPTIFSELSPEADDLVHLGLCQVKKDVTFNVVAIGEIDHVRRYNQPLIGNHDTVAKINALIDAPNTGLRAALVDAYFADVFSEPALRPGHYKATAALASELLLASSSGQPIIDGFFYPSVAHRGGMNLVLREESFHSKFEWVRFEVAKIQHRFGFGIYGWDISAQSKSIQPDGNIVW